MKSFILVVISILSFNTSFSQQRNTSQEVAKDIKNRKLLVVLARETYPEVKQMNENLKLAIKNHWNFSEDYVFTDEDKVNQYKGSEYAILAFEKFLVKELTLFGGRPTNTEMHIVADLLDSYNPKNAKCSLSLVHQYVMSDSEDDYDLYIDHKNIIFGVQRINKMLWNAFEGNDSFFYNELKDRTNSLKDKTMLIDIANLDEKLNKEEIAQIYPYDFEIMEGSEIAEKIRNRNPKYAYFGYLRGVLGAAGTSQVFLTYAVNAEDGSLLSTTLKPIKHQLVLKKKQLKNIVKRDSKFD